MATETALHRTYRQRRKRISDRTYRLVVAADMASTEGFVSRVVPIVLDAQRQVVREADVYLSTEAGLATATSTEPWGLDADQLIGAAARHGDYLEDVYGRNHRAAAGSFTERMAREVATDIVLADRNATFVHTAADTRVLHYRRTLTPGAKHCGLCVVAATRIYYKKDLRAIHHHCSCGTQPVYGTVKGWNKPTNDVLTDLYKQAGGTSMNRLSRIRVDNPNLPEVDIIETTLGPTLTRVTP